MSQLSAKNAGQTGLNRTTQAVSSTSTWYAFAGQVTTTTDSTYDLLGIGGQATDCTDRRARSGMVGVRLSSCISSNRTRRRPESHTRWSFAQPQVGNGFFSSESRASRFQSFQACRCQHNACVGTGDRSGHKFRWPSGRFDTFLT